jgi:hypothetical protein
MKGPQDYRDRNDPEEETVCAGCYRAEDNCVCDDACSECYGSGTDYNDGDCPKCGSSGRA